MKGYLKYIDHYFSHDEMAEKVGLCFIYLHADTYFILVIF